MIDVRCWLCLCKSKLSLTVLVQEGYSEDLDSIDGQAVLDINVYNHERVLNQAVYSLLQPYLPGVPPQSVSSR